MKATICPVCKGEGQVCSGVVWWSNKNPPVLRQCHGCDGKGWVVIPEHILTYRPRTKPIVPES